MGTELEEMLGGESAIAVNTPQLAIQMCLEVLGSRTHIIPCILPVNAPPDTLSAVLRAGAQPILLDINGGSLQMDVEMLQEALEEVESAVVILTRPGGLPVEERLLEAVQDVPTIIDTRLSPHKKLNQARDLCGTFNVFHLKDMGGSGAVIMHKYAEQQKMLRMLRSGVMGHSGELPRLLDAEAATAVSLYGYNMTNYQDDGKRLRSYLSDYTHRGIIPWELTPENVSDLFIFVPNNAARIVAQLRSYGVEASQASYPLHLLDEVRQRYQEPPKYPVAEEVMNQVISIPVETYTDTKEIARIIGTVSSG